MPPHASNFYQAPPVVQTAPPWGNTISGHIQTKFRMREGLAGAEIHATYQHSGAATLTDPNDPVLVVDRQPTYGANVPMPLYASRVRDTIAEAHLGRRLALVEGPVYNGMTQAGRDRMTAAAINATDFSDGLAHPRDDVLIHTMAADPVSYMHALPRAAQPRWRVAQVGQDSNVEARVAPNAKLRTGGQVAAYAPSYSNAAMVVGRRGDDVPIHVNPAKLFGMGGVDTRIPQFAFNRMMDAGAAYGAYMLPSDHQHQYPTPPPSMPAMRTNPYALAFLTQPLGR